VVQRDVHHLVCGRVVGTVEGGDVVHFGDEEVLGLLDAVGVVVIEVCGVVR
jgi:hypothetical protein